MYAVQQNPHLCNVIAATANRLLTLGWLAVLAGRAVVRLPGHIGGAAPGRAALP